MRHTAYIALGANVGDRKDSLERAVRTLSEVGEVVRVSSWYETEPVEVTDQPWFLNGVVELTTELSASELMKKLLAIEEKMGRKRTRVKGPRNIDLDLLLFDNEVVNEPELTLPHPEMHKRAFVLTPLAEIAPEAMHPILRKTAKTLLESLPQHEAVRPLSSTKS